MVFNDRFCPGRDTAGAATYAFANSESHTDIYADAACDAIAQREPDANAKAASQRNADANPDAQSHAPRRHAGSGTFAYASCGFTAFACAIGKTSIGNTSIRNARASATGACANGYAALHAGSRRATQALLS